MLYADAYLGEDRLVEAVDFLVKAEADERLDELSQTAAERGDAFLLRLIETARSAEPDPRRWHALAEVAEREGKTAYAETARRIAGLADE